MIRNQLEPVHPSTLPMAWLEFAQPDIKAVFSEHNIFLQKSHRQKHHRRPVDDVDRTLFMVPVETVFDIVVAVFGPKILG